MTTIFADHKSGVMVCDSRMNVGETWLPATKVYLIGGELVGTAGDAQKCDAWLEWHRGGRTGSPPDTGEEFQGLILRKSGVYEVTIGAHEVLIERGFHGIGSGGGYATAAFMAGADAKRAVAIACDVDASSGGPVVVHKLKA